MYRLYLAALILLFSGVMTSCNEVPEKNTSDITSSATGTIPAPANLQYDVLNVYPHDTLSYTQGLIIYDGQLLESTGGNPEYNPYKSWVGKVDYKTGKISQQIPLDAKYFGEGISILNNKLYQLTWTSNKGFVYDAKTFKKLQEFPLKTQGWGITNDSTNLIISDGSSNLYYLNPTDFSTIKVVGVSDNNGPVNNLNELEFINGYIYANRYQTYYILKIDPSNGQVVGRADLTGILERYSKENINKDKYTSGDAVLNGIAYDGKSGKLFVTGKLWPNIYEITLK
ncbi:glutaminyl-peptide cyclotransferase [Flavihumibacter fluvii]|uniref:glutaminyl-peptide cyclotransferase n=1 Tax=Flavihumibacter fluvii TaxID=2838157 RepID=UPI001BDE016D|nr:glutaminyl-peptide cyclotransferase [Flavihumibacter fluvii]ULQ54478.1 glutaminyl-peptide cyclotransferase [Flavihumibacter fluvii]